jgi:hypothetical protein
MARGQLTRLAKLLLRFGPRLLEHSEVMFDTLWGEGRLPPRARYAMHLRLARLARSPAALLVLPPLARVAGLSGREIDAAIAGELDDLDETSARVVAWASSVAGAGGEMPIDWPPAARRMTMRERERVLLLTRLELVVHTLLLVGTPEGLRGAAAQELASS